MDTPAELVAIAQDFGEVAHTFIASNTPYGTGGDAVATAERTAAKDAFMEGEDTWPAISRYPLLANPPLDVSERQYSGLLTRIAELDQQTGGETPATAVLYEQVARKLAEVYRHKEVVRLLGHVAASNGARDQESRDIAAVEAEESRHRAANMSGELFGEPEASHFEGLLSADVAAAVQAQSSSDAAKAKVANEYLALLGFDSAQAAAWSESHLSRENSHELSDETIRIIREDFYAIFPDLKKAMEPFGGRTSNTKPADAKPAFEAALRGVGIGGKCEVEMLPGKKHAAETKRGRIIYGENNKDFTPLTIITVPIHEALHALRYLNAATQLEDYLRRALPGSLQFDEGYGVTMEQVVSGQRRVPGAQYYVQLGLLKGMHAAGMNEEQSFRSAYEIMWRRAALLEDGELTDAKLTELRTVVYGSVMRTARGNARDNRDISYFEGALKATRFLNETAKLPAHVRRARLRWSQSGIFDPTNPGQAELFGGDPAAAYLEAA